MTLRRPMSKLQALPSIATLEDVAALDRQASTYWYTENQRRTAKPKYTPNEYMKNLIQRWRRLVED